MTCILKVSITVLFIHRTCVCVFRSPPSQRLLKNAKVLPIDPKVKSMYTYTCKLDHRLCSKMSIMTYFMIMYKLLCLHHTRKILITINAPSEYFAFIKLEINKFNFLVENSKDLCEPRSLFYKLKFTGSL